MKVNNNILAVYAAYSKKEEIRLQSSSGGIFSLLAENYIRKDGVVYGVAMSNDCMKAEFVRVRDIDSISKLRGSKYLQACIGDAYKLVRNDLELGLPVLFTGTGCQINGLKMFLGKEYDSLICVDVICHGVPSPVLWKKYVQYQEHKNGGKLRSINFRCKDDSWKNFGMKEVLDINTQGVYKKMYISKDKDSFMQMFLKDYCLRPSCYKCIARNVKMADITMADFWGINNVAPEMNDGKGTSLILIRTEKGKSIFEKISVDTKLKEVSYRESIQYNLAEYKSCVRPRERNTFFEDMAELEFEKLEKKYIFTIKIFLAKIKRKIKNAIKQIP